MPQRLAPLPVRLHGDLRISGRPLWDLTPGPSTSGASLTEGKKKKVTQNGMYMPHPHNYKEWAARRSKYNVDGKDNQKAKKKRNAEADAADPPK